MFVVCLQQEIVGYLVDIHHKVCGLLYKEHICSVKCFLVPLFQTVCGNPCKVNSCKFKSV